jgi:hypothetical protein
MNINVLKTICGAIHYAMHRYNEKEISFRDWDYFCSALGLSISTVYCIELTKEELFFATKNFSIRYKHHNMHEQRTIEINSIAY